MLHIYYGKGKGKTSAALGLILRAAGYNKKIVLFQFLKPRNLFSGEYASLKKLTCVKQIRFDQQHPMFMENKEKKQIIKLKKHIQKSILQLKEIIQKGNFDILVCDEILNITRRGFIKDSDIIKMLGKIKNKKEIILTGRNRPNRLANIADYITEFRLEKHPFQKGTLARRSIEF